MIPLTPKTGIITAADCQDTPDTAEAKGHPGWISRVRDARSDAGQYWQFRAGPVASIEAQSLRPPFAWSPIMLPDGGTEFATREDRDAALAQLNNLP